MFLNDGCCVASSQTTTVTTTTINCLCVRIFNIILGPAVSRSFFLLCSTSTDVAATSITTNKKRQGHRNWRSRTMFQVNIDYVVVDFFFNLI